MVGQGKHMNISSVIVIPHPDRIAVVRERLGEIAGVELQAESPEGKMIVTIETDGDGDTVKTYELICQMDGVLSASMVYHRHEVEPDSKIFVEA